MNKLEQLKVTEKKGKTSTISYELYIIEDLSFKVDDAINVNEKLFSFIPHVNNIEGLKLWRGHFIDKSVPFVVTESKFKGKSGYTLWKEKYVELGAEN